MRLSGRVSAIYVEETIGQVINTRAPDPSSAHASCAEEVKFDPNPLSSRTGDSYIHQTVSIPCLSVCRVLQACGLTPLVIHLVSLTSTEAHKCYGEKIGIEKTKFRPLVSIFQYFFS